MLQKEKAERKIEDKSSQMRGGVTFTSWAPLLQHTWLGLGEVPLGLKSHHTWLGLGGVPLGLKSDHKQ